MHSLTNNHCNKTEIIRLLSDILCSCKRDNGGGVWFLQMLQEKHVIRMEVNYLTVSEIRFFRFELIFVGFY